jgi:lipid-binding SYLF domain-containing protein
MKIRLLLILAFTTSPLFLSAQLGGWHPNLEEKAEQTIRTFKEKNSDFEAFFDEAYAYVVFPSIGKGGAGFGAALGTGIAYKSGRPVGKARVTQVTVGFQFGGQAYSEVIFFEKKEDFERFKESKFELAAQASAVAIDLGASINIAYEDGVAVFTMTKGGLMYEASIGGQKFKFKPDEPEAR